MHCHLCLKAAKFKHIAVKPRDDAIIVVVAIIGKSEMRWLANSQYW